MSIIAHLCAVILILVAPKWFPFLAAPRGAPLSCRRNRPSRRASFLFSHGSSGRCEAARPRDASDLDRMARSRERAQQPTNSAAVCRGQQPGARRRPPREVARGRGRILIRRPGGRPRTRRQSRAEGVDATSSLQLPVRGRRRRRTAPRPVGDDRRLARRCAAQPAAVRPERNLRQPGGGRRAVRPRNIQFDTKGVEFGP